MHDDAGIYEGQSCRKTWLKQRVRTLIFAPVDIEALVEHVEGLFKYQILI